MGDYFERSICCSAAMIEMSGREERAFLGSFSLCRAFRVNTRPRGLRGHGIQSNGRRHRPRRVGYLEDCHRSEGLDFLEAAVFNVKGS